MPVALNKKFNKAFSLIELSIVVLIIGILIAGVTQGSRLVRQSRFSVAKSLTQSSPVASIPNMVAWFETTNDNSIASATNATNPEDGDLISSWSDVNPQSTNKIIVSNTGVLRPTYTASGINNLPSITFNGSQYLFSALASGGNIPLNAGATSFTYVAVWSNTNNATGGVVFEQNSTTLIAGKRAGFYANINAKYGFSGESNDWITTATFTVNKPMASIMTIAATSPTTAAINIYDNNSTYSGTIGSTSGLSNALFYVGAKASNQTEKFVGSISEIIIFERALKASEISDIKSYLAKKYAMVMP